MALPRCDGCHRSTKTPPVQVIGADPKKPVKKRVIRTVCRSLAVAVPKDMIIETANGSRTGHFRPYTSDSGAQSSGPKPHLEEAKTSAKTSAQLRRPGRRDGPEEQEAGSQDGNLRGHAKLVCDLFVCGRISVVYCCQRPSLQSVASMPTYAVLAQTEPRLVRL